MARRLLLASSIGVSGAHAVRVAMPWLTEATISAHAAAIVGKSGIDQVLRLAMRVVPQLNPVSQLLSLANDVEKIEDPTARARERRGMLALMMRDQPAVEALADEACEDALVLDAGLEVEAIEAVAALVDRRENGAGGSGEL